MQKLHLPGILSTHYYQTSSCEICDNQRFKSGFLNFSLINLWNILWSKIVVSRKTFVRHCTMACLLYNCLQKMKTVSNKTVKNVILNTGKDLRLWKISDFGCSEHGTCLKLHLRKLHKIVPKMRKTLKISQILLCNFFPGHIGRDSLYFLVTYVS